MRVFSGIQPTGNLHLGNYLGAIKQWVNLQNEYESLFCIVDLHAITVPQNPAELLEATRKTAATYIACGINPDSNIIFHQSAVSGHVELAWLLGCNTPLGWLNRMTQFKEKAGKKKDNASLGLYGYPVLMAADILLYNATHVPVGDDQKQHLELARDIAQSINAEFEREVFVQPEPLILGAAPRVMSLRNGANKMSKSDASEKSRINLTDTADEIASKVRGAKSDSNEFIGLADDRPEASNLLRIYSALADEKLEDVALRFESTSFADFKGELCDLAVEKLVPISEEINRLMGDTWYLDNLLKTGAHKANDIASTKLKEVKELFGFLV